MDYVNLNAQQAASDWTDRIVPYGVFTALLALAIFIGYTNFQSGRPFRIESSTTLPPTSVLDALQRQLARDGWVLGYRDSTSLVMAIDNRATLGSTAAIGCFSAWLGLIHLATSQRSITVEIAVAKAPNGTTIITNGSKSGSYLRYMAHHLNALPKS